MNIDNYDKYLGLGAIVLGIIFILITGHATITIVVLFGLFCIWGVAIGPIIDTALIRRKHGLAASNPESTDEGRISSLLMELPMLGYAAGLELKNFIYANSPDTLQLQAARTATLDHLTKYTEETRQIMLRSAPGCESVDIQYKPMSWPMGTVGAIEFVRRFSNGGVDMYVVKIGRVQEDLYAVFYSS